MYNSLDKAIKRKVYLLWYNMMRRCCTTTNPDYKYYGKQGVEVCDRWKTLDNFAEDIQQLEGWDFDKFKDGLIQLDKDSTGGDLYSPDRCRFVTGYKNKMDKPQQQTTTVGVSPEGVKHLFRNKAQFAREYGLNSGTISACVYGHIKRHKGWEFYKQDCVVETLEAIERVSN